MVGWCRLASVETTESGGYYLGNINGLLNWAIAGWARGKLSRFCSRNRKLCDNFRRFECFRLLWWAFKNVNWGKFRFLEFANNKHTHDIELTELVKRPVGKKNSPIVEWLAPVCQNGEINNSFKELWRWRNFHFILCFLSTTRIDDIVPIYNYAVVIFIIVSLSVVAYVTLQVTRERTRIVSNLNNKFFMRKFAKREGATFNQFHYSSWADPQILCHYITQHDDSTPVTTHQYSSTHQNVVFLYSACGSIYFLFPMKVMRWEFILLSPWNVSLSVEQNSP